MMTDPARVLVVEDNQDHAELTRRALTRTQVPMQVEVLQDGEDAIEYLFPEDDGDDGVTVDLILLDLHLPGVEGKQVLERIRSSEGLSSTPVVMLSSSDHNAEIEECYRLGANTFITKPVDWGEFQLALRKMVDYWFDTAARPGPGPG
jgi:two-component system response regulator